MRKFEPWPLGLGIFLSLFAIGTIVATVVLSRQDVTMVTDRYYEKDLRFQQRYEMLERTRNLASKPVIAWERDSRNCLIVFPDSNAAHATSGSIRFYSVSGMARDVEHPLALDNAGRQRVAGRDLARGAWVAQLTWTRDGLDYYLEERLFVE